MDELLTPPPLLFKQTLNLAGFRAEEIKDIFNAVMDAHPSLIKQLPFAKNSPLDLKEFMSDLKAIPGMNDVHATVANNPALLIEFLDPKWEP